MRRIPFCFLAFVAAARPRVRVLGASSTPRGSPPHPASGLDGAADGGSRAVAPKPRQLVALRRILLEELLEFVALNITWGARLSEHDGTAYVVN